MKNKELLELLNEVVEELETEQFVAERSSENNGDYYAGRVTAYQDALHKLENVLEKATAKPMTKNQIEKFAVGYPVPTDWVEIILRKYNYNKDKAHQVLCKSRDEIAQEIQN